MLRRTVLLTYPHLMRAYKRQLSPHLNLIALKIKWVLSNSQASIDLTEST